MHKNLHPTVEDILLALEAEDPARSVGLANFFPGDGMHADHLKEVLLITKVGLEGIKKELGEDDPQKIPLRWHLLISHLFPSALNALASGNKTFRIGTAIFRGVELIPREHGWTPLLDGFCGIRATVVESGYVKLGDRLSAVEHVEAG